MKLKERLGYFAAVSIMGIALGAVYRVRPPGPKEDPSFVALQKEEAALAGFDHETVVKMRSERDALARKVTAPPVAELKRVIGPHWTWMTASDGKFAVTCRGETANDWPGILAGLVALERQPGVFLESAELTGDGRQLLQTRLAVRVRASASETKPTAKQS